MLKSLTLFTLLAYLASASPLKLELPKRSFGSDNVESFSGFLLPDAGIEIGTPSQSITVLLDTGSFNLILVEESYCSAGSCDQLGAYDADKSSSSFNTTVPFGGSYGDGTSFQSFLYKDIVTIADLTLNNFTIISGYVSDYSNILGLGYTPDSTLAVVPWALKNQGKISRALFSLYSSSLTGGVVFGGVDTGRYTGTLESVPVLSDEYWIVAISGITADCGYSNTAVTSYLVDSGAEVSSLTEAQYHEINQLFGGVMTSSSVDPYGAPTYLFKCSNAKPLTFSFSGKNITMDPSTFVLPAIDSAGKLLTSDDGFELCLTTFLYDSSSPTIGADFLQNIFAVFDYEGAEVAFAQAAEGDENLVEAQTSIPGAVKAAQYDVSEKSVAAAYTTPSTTTVTGVAASMVFYSGTYSSQCVSTSTVSPSSSSSSTSAAISVTASPIFTSNGVVYFASTNTRVIRSPACFSCLSTEPLSSTTVTVEACPGGCTKSVSPPSPTTNSLSSSSSFPSSSPSLATAESSSIPVLSSSLSASSLLSSSSFFPSSSTASSSVASSLQGSSTVSSVHSEASALSSVSSVSSVSSIVATSSEPFSVSSSVPPSAPPSSSVPASSSVSSSIPSVSSVETSSESSVFSFPETFSISTASSSAPLLTSNTVPAAPSSPLSTSEPASSVYDISSYQSVSVSLTGGSSYDIITNATTSAVISTPPLVSFTLSTDSETTVLTDTTSTQITSDLPSFTPVQSPLSIAGEAPSSKPSLITPLIIASSTVLDTTSVVTVQIQVTVSSSTAPAVSTFQGSAGLLVSPALMVGAFLLI